MFPGYRLYPFLSHFSPPSALNSPSNKLYSTLIVRFFLLSLWIRVVIAPTAYPGFLGVAIELKSKFFSADTPNNIGKALNANGFVSWKNNTHFLFYCDHFSISLPWYKRVWMSPWPCGLVYISNVCLLNANLPELSIIAGIFYCFKIFICYFYIPK